MERRNARKMTSKQTKALAKCISGEWHLILHIDQGFLNSLGKITRSLRLSACRKGKSNKNGKDAHKKIKTSIEGIRIFRPTECT